MAYEHVRRSRRQEIRYNTTAGVDTRLYYPCVLESGEYSTTTATIALFNVGGTTIQSSTAMAAEGSPSPILYFDVPTSTSVTAYALGEGYRANITWYNGATVHYDRVAFDIVREPLHIRVRDDDLVEYESELATVKEPGESSWSRKINVAIDWVHRRVRQKSTQNGFGRPALLIGSDQVAELAVLRALELIFGDMEGREDDEAKYRTAREQEEEAVLSSLSYAAGDGENPGDPEEINMTGITLSR